MTKLDQTQSSLGSSKRLSVLLKSRCTSALRNGDQEWRSGEGAWYPETMPQPHSCDLDFIGKWLQTIISRVSSGNVSSFRLVFLMMITYNRVVGAYLLIAKSADFNRGWLVSTWWMLFLVASRGAAGLVKSGKTINANTNQYALAA